MWAQILPSLGLLARAFVRRFLRLYSCYNHAVDYITLHELSVHLDVSDRVWRHRLRQLLATGKLVLDRDCRRDDYVDSTHFVWRVDSDAFVKASGLHPVTKPATTVLSLVNTLGDQPLPVVNNSVSTPSKTIPNLDTTPSRLEREMIDILKDQVRVKDGQIAELSEQNKTLSSLNHKLNGAVLRQSDQIQNLLRLTGGKSDDVDSAANGAQQQEVDVDRSVTGASPAQAA